MKQSTQKLPALPARSFLFPWLLWVPIALTLLLLAYFWLTAQSYTEGRPGVPLDDAWIHYQFARNLSQGNGFSFNAGQPTPGSTAPLWTVMLAVLGVLTTDFLITSLLLSGFFLLLTVYLTYRLAQEISDSFWLPLLAALGVATSGRLLWAGLSGMELTAFMAASLATVWLYQRHGLTPLTALLVGLASLLRPEAHLLFLLLVVDTVWCFWRPTTGERGGWKPTARRLLIAALIYGALNAPYTVFSLQVTGKPLANTFYAKSRTEVFYSWQTLQETLTLHWRDNYIAFLLIPFGLWPLWQRSRVTAGWLLGLLLLLPIIVPFIWHHGRYSMPLIPFQMLAAAAGAGWIMRQISGRWQATSPAPDSRAAVPAPGLSGAPSTTALRGRKLGQPQNQSSSYPYLKQKQRISLATGALLILFLWGGIVHLPRWARMLGQNSREILDIDVAMGHWLAANTPPDAIIAVDDLGAIGFLSGRELFDLNGLITPEMWAAMDSEHRPAATTRLMAAAGVDYLAFFPDWHPALEPSTVMAAFNTESHTIIGVPQAAIHQTEFPYWPAQAAAAEVRQVTLGEQIQLEGFTFSAPANIQSGLMLDLYWSAITTVPERYHVFIHLLDEEGQVVAQVDREPAGGRAPTLVWQAGDIILDQQLLPLPPDLLPGSYHLQVGLYSQTSMQRLTAVGENVADNAIYLTTWTFNK